MDEQLIIKRYTNKASFTFIFIIIIIIIIIIYYSAQKLI